MLPVGKRLNRGFKLKIPNLNSSIEPSRKELIERGFAPQNGKLIFCLFFHQVLLLKDMEEKTWEMLGVT